MNKKFFTATLTILLTVSLVAPQAFLIAPQPVYAQVTDADLAMDVPTGDWITRLKETLNLISTYTNTAANVAEQINTYVLAPLAFVLSGNMMKTLTAGVVSFVIGKANGTGIPQFVVDVQKSMQTVGDSQALAYLRQFGTNSNSPFAASVASSLKNNYLSKTSLAGFWANNMNTLYRTSPNVPAFLAGRWSQGGVSAWFALTTQVQNNPYTFYQNSQAQMASLVGSGSGGATGARLAELNWGKGFTSWCGAATTDNTDFVNDGTAMEGENPGDFCTNKDGTPGTIRTPGSVISDTLNKVLGGQQDIITRMGNVGPQVNSILGNIASVMQTVSFAQQILGGASLSGATGGLLGSGSGSVAGSRSALENFTPTQNASGFTSGYLEATNSGVLQGAANISISGPEKSKLIDQYEKGWVDIRTATNAALASVTSLASFCDSAVASASSETDLGACQASENNAFIAAATAQATSAREAISSKITPVINKMDADVVGAVVCKARAMVEKIQCELNAPANTVVYCDRGCNSNHQIIAINTSTPTNVMAEYPADIQTLQNMAPSAEDVASLQVTQASGGARAIPEGSLNVSASPSIISQMNLINANAQALKTSVCTKPQSACQGGGGDGSGDN